MVKSVPRPEFTTSEVTGSGTAATGRCATTGFNLLLVSRNDNWAQAVSGATAELGGALSTCRASEALTRLAGVAPHYSHLLVEEADAEDLGPALADLATEIADPEIDVLMLGAIKATRPDVRVIQAADAHAVRDALLATVPRNRSDMTIGLADLRSALDQDMIATRYQPIIRIADRRPIGLESLARLNHPVIGTLLPDQFVPQIETAGLSARLTELISARVIADLTTPVLGACGLRISVNFPLDVLLLPAAVDRLEAQRAAAAIPASQIIIELTESQPVEDILPLRRALERLRSLGYGAAIDDVGPAVPRLAPLLELPFTSLKLDKDQVRQVITSPTIRAFLTTTITQAKQHGMSVVAEGVETEEIWAQMRALGADEAQGFLASRPLPAAAVPIWLEAWNATPARAPG